MAKLVGAAGMLMIGALIVVVFAVLFWALFGTTMSLVAALTAASLLYWVRQRSKG